MGGGGDFSFCSGLEPLTRPPTPLTAAALCCTSVCAGARSSEHFYCCPLEEKNPTKRHRTKSGVLVGFYRKEHVSGRPVPRVGESCRAPLQRDPASARQLHHDVTGSLTGTGNDSGSDPELLLINPHLQEVFENHPAVTQSHTAPTKPPPSVMVSD